MQLIVRVQFMHRGGDAELVKCSGVHLDLRLRTRSFDRKQHSTLTHQRQAPFHQTIHRSKRPRGHARSRPSCLRHLGGTSADDTDVAQLEIVHDLSQECGTSRHRLHQVDVQIGSAQRQWDARQSSAAADVDHPSTVRDEVTDRETVQDVTLPQPRHFARADEAPDHAVGSQSICVPDSDTEPIGEHRSRR